MEDKRVIYINSLYEENNLNNFINELENKLKENEYIVYRNENQNMDSIIDENNKINPDIYLSLHTYGSQNSINGPNIYINKQYSLSDDIAKKIYDQLKLIYYNPIYNKNINYTENISELEKIKSPSIYIELFSYNNKEDNEWFLNKEEKIVDAVFLGIDNYFKKRD